MRRFGEYSGLSETVTNYIKQIITKIEKKEIEDLSIYYGYPIIELDRKESVMKGCVVSRKGIIALYENETEKSVYNRHFTQILMDSSNLSELFFNGSKVIECVNLNDADIVIEILNRNDIISHEEYKQLNGIIQKVYGMNSVDEREIQKETSLGSIIKKRNNAMNMLDENQFNGIYNKIGNHMRIRGLAGSGKTILLVKKMAYTHFKYPDLDLAYIFYTKSLKQYVKGLFKLYYKDFEKYKEPDMSKIHILHSWGGNEMKGFYSQVCADNFLQCRNFREAKSLHGDDKYEAVCAEVLRLTNGNVKKTYNYIFVDEAQDFKLSLN